MSIRLACHFGSDLISGSPPFARKSHRRPTNGIRRSYRPISYRHLASIRLRSLRLFTFRALTMSGLPEGGETVSQVAYHRSHVAIFTSSFGPPSPARSNNNCWPAIQQMRSISDFRRSSERRSQLSPWNSLDAFWTRSGICTSTGQCCLPSQQG